MMLMMVMLTNDVLGTMTIMMMMMMITVTVANPTLSDPTTINP